MAGLMQWLRSKFSSGNDGEISYRTVYIGRHPVLMPVTDEFGVSDADNRDVNVAVAFRIISESIAELPILGQKRTIANGKEAWETELDSAVSALFQRPNPFHDKTDLVCHILQSLLSDGNSYFIISGTKGIAPKLELWPSPPSMMQLAVAKKTGRPFGYIYDPYNAKVFFKLEEIWHIKLYHRDSPFLGKSPLVPALNQMRANKYAVEHNKKFFENGAEPSLLFQYENAMGYDPDEEAKFLESWKARHEGVKNSHKVGILPPGYKPVPISSTFKDMMFDTQIRLNREQIYALLGIPPGKGGVYEYANYANMLAQDKTMWTDTIKPKLTLITSTAKRQIIERYFDNGGNQYRIKFDLSDVQALKDDELVKAQARQIYVNTGIRTVNEFRAEDGLDPVEWGDTPPAAAYGSEAVPDADSDAPVKKNAADKFAAEDYQAKFEKRVDKVTPKYRDIIQQYFMGQRGRVIEAIDKGTAHGAVMSALKLVAVAFDDDSGDAIPDDVSKIFDVIAENAILREAVAIYHRDTVSDIAQEIIEEIGASISFDVTNPNVRVALNQLANRSALINQTTFRQIKAMIGQAYDEGWSLQQLASEIQSLYSDYTKNRAMRVARTEMISVVNSGTNSAIEQTGSKKKWVTAVDGRERPEHRAANGQVVDGSQPFIVGGEPLKYPGDPSGRPGNTIQCRCAVAPVITNN